MTSPDHPDLALDMGLFRAFGFRVVEASGDRVVIDLPISSVHHQPYGIVHGGVYCSVIETAASVGGALWFGDRGQVVGVANSTDFLRATSSGTLRATATPVHRGRSQQLWQVEVRDEDGRLAARGQVRLANLPGGHAFAPKSPPDTPAVGGQGTTSG
jgi:1,4-dihydroxy-2-naphthoyl-CoA hydrolase